MPTDCEACAARGELSFAADNERSPPRGSALHFEYHQGDTYACPDCGRLYLRTLTNGDVPFLFRDVDEHSYRKLAEHISPRVRAPPPPPPPQPPQTERVRVWRCPKCGSTGVSESTWELSFEEDVRLTCGGCRHEEVVERPACAGWVVALELPKVNRVIPAFIALDEEAPAAVVEAPAPHVAAPKPAPKPAPVEAPPSGCARCMDATAPAAWNAVQGKATHTFVHEPHFAVYATRCACGQPFVFVFTERVDFQGGFDTQVELAVALWPEELIELETKTATTLTRLARGRRFLMKSTENEPRWVDRGFSIGPYG